MRTSKIFFTRPSSVVIILSVATLAVLMAGCASSSEISKEAVTQPAVDQPQSNLKDPGRVLVKLWASPGTFDKVTNATLFGQNLYVAGMPAALHAIDVFDGARVWSHPCKDRLAANVMESGDTIYLVEGREFVTLDAEDGVELIRDRTRLGVRSPIMPGDESWVIATTDDRIWGVVPNTGRGYWHITFDDPITDTVEDGGDTLYVHTLRGTIYRASRRSREIEWKLPFSKPASSPLTLLEGRLLVGNQDYFLYEVSTETGEVLDRTSLSAPVLGKPLAAGSMFYIATTDGKLHALDTKAGLSEKWTISNATRALTAIGDNVIFLGRRAGEPYLGVAKISTGEIVTETSAKGFVLFEASPTSGVVFAIAANGNILAIAHRDALDSLPQKPVLSRDQQSPEKVAVREAILDIQEAARTADTDKLLRGLTAESATFMQNMIDNSGVTKALEGFTRGMLVMGKVKIKGETATVRTNVFRDKPGEIGIVYMSNVAGQWKMDLVKSMGDEAAD